MHSPIPAWRIVRVLGLICLTVSLVGSLAALASERRAKPPTIAKDRFRGTFFDSVDEAIRGERPRLGQATSAPSRVAGSPTAGSTAAASAPSVGDGGASLFTKLISPASLEDEIKRVRLEFDGAVSTPAAFKGGDYQRARLHLTTLATLFAVIVEHEGEVRWKKDAAAARDLLARSAANCKSGSLQVFNETKLRRADLEDLVSGSGLASRQAEAENDWSMIADRVPLMQYAEQLLEGPLKEGSRNAETVQAEEDALRRSAEVMAIVAQVLRTEGLTDADDADYAELCDELIEASRGVSLALDQGDPTAVGRAVAAIQQSCNKCHENYR
ncbi:MAG: hypothetical protein EA381_04190 [Planctomycetaceae bacterium]|nr:MAG: hypothetical protein EA381_04190 [Planctomycetaceae bacterium]